MCLQNASTSKVVYLIRHAETTENIRMKGLHDVGRAIQNGRLPSSQDIKLGSQFVGMVLKGDADSELSAKGKQQVLQLQSILQENCLYEKLDMVAHSPLQRAKETCYGIFGLSPGSPRGDSNERIKNKPIVELSCLTEVTPWEMISQGNRPIRRRIQAFQSWIESQGNDVGVMAVVGHSEYFMIMLGQDEKFKNCDVWKTTYESGGKWTVDTMVVRLDMNEGDGGNHR